MTEALSNLIDIASLVPEIWLVMERQTDRHKDNLTHLLLTISKSERLKTTTKRLRFEVFLFKFPVELNIMSNL